MKTSSQFSLFKSFLLALFIASLTNLTSCNFEPENTAEPLSLVDSVPELVGTWKSTLGDSLEITGTSFTYLYDEQPQYAGTIKNIRLINDNKSSGYLTIKFTTVTPSDWTNYTVGHYYVVYWKDLTATTLAQAAPYKDGGSNDGFSSLAEAEAEYTLTNGYFGYTDTYTKQ